MAPVDLMSLGTIGKACACSPPLRRAQQHTMSRSAPGAHQFLQEIETREPIRRAEPCACAAEVRRGNGGEHESETRSGVPATRGREDVPFAPISVVWECRRTGVGGTGSGMGGGGGAARFRRGRGRGEEGASCYQQGSLIRCDMGARWARVGGLRWSACPASHASPGLHSYPGTSRPEQPADRGRLHGKCTKQEGDDPLGSGAPAAESWGGRGMNKGQQCGKCSAGIGEASAANCPTCSAQRPLCQMDVQEGQEGPCHELLIPLLWGAVMRRSGQPQPP